MNSRIENRIKNPIFPLSRHYIVDALANFRFIEMFALDQVHFLFLKNFIIIRSKLKKSIENRSRLAQLLDAKFI